MKRINQKMSLFIPKEIIHRAKILDLVIKRKITQSQAAKETGKTVLDKENKCATNSRLNLLLEVKARNKSRWEVRE